VGTVLHQVLSASHVVHHSTQNDYKIIVSIITIYVDKNETGTYLDPARSRGGEMRIEIRLTFSRSEGEGVLRRS
jgi:hypothetical protein